MNVYFEKTKKKKAKNMQFFQQKSQQKFDECNLHLSKMEIQGYELIDFKWFFERKGATNFS